MSYANVEVMVDNGIYDAGIDENFIPHIFLKVTNPDGTTSYYGFAPKTTGLTGEGKIFDDRDHPYDTSSGPIPLNQTEYDALQEYIDTSIANPPYYDLPQGVQCTAWALNALSDAKIIPSSLSPNMDASNPIFDVIETIMFNPYTQALGFDLYNVINDLLNADPVTQPLPGVDDFIPFDPNNPNNQDDDNAPDPLNPPPPPKDPLVLDTDKDGFISTVSLEDSNAYFDLTGDGIKERVSWIAPNDGILAYDKNESGKIDGIDEVFGNFTKNGFEELKELIDSNHDGKIDRQDELFNRLQIWNDTNGDGTTQTNELSSLKDAGVKSIDLNYVDTNITLGGATLTQASKYTDAQNNKKLGSGDNSLLFLVPTFYVGMHATIQTAKTL